MNKQNKMYILTMGIWIILALVTYGLVWFVGWELNLLLVLNFSLTLVIFIVLWDHVNQKEETNTD